MNYIIGHFSIVADCNGGNLYFSNSNIPVNKRLIYFIGRTECPECYVGHHLKNYCKDFGI